MYTIVTFSPTGNAAHLASLLEEHLHGQIAGAFALEKIAPTDLPSGGHLIILYPIHAFNAPRNVKQWVKDLPAGRFSAISLIAVGSADIWINEAVSTDLRKPLEAKDYPIHVDALLGMPVTMLIAIDVETGRELVQTAEARIAEIATALLEGNIIKSDPSGKARLMNTLGKAESLAGRAFGLELHATDACTSCGLCWSDCPMGNITEGKDGKPRFGTNCLMCLRCVYRCPVKAIKPRLSAFVPIKGGYDLADYLKDS